MTQTPPPPPGDTPPPPGGTPPPPPPGAVPPPPGQPPGFAVPGGPVGTQTDGLAIGGLITAIVGIFICGIVPIPQVVALFLASNSTKKIAASGGRLGGDGLNKATKIISWIWIGLSVVFWVIIIVVAASGGFDDDDNDDDNDFGLGTAAKLTRVGIQTSRAVAGFVT